MDEAKLKILKMVEEGKITADDAAKLLDAAGSGPESAATDEEGKPRRMPRWLKVQVQEEGRSRPNVNVTIPFALIRWGLKLAPMGMRFAPEHARERIRESGVDLNNLNIEELIAAFSELGEHSLVDVDEDGEKVRVWLE
jgi:hypothetical protein